MSAVESGTNWEILRDFIPRHMTSAAAEQADMMRGMRARYIREFTRSEGALANEDLETLVVGVTALRSFAIADMYFSDLLRIYDLTEEWVLNDSDEFFLNFYGIRGATVRHRDSYADTTLAVGLEGRAEAQIQDPATGIEHTFELDPGDALYLNNVAEEADRPLHVVRNVLAIPRTALVNG